MPQLRGNEPILGLNMERGIGKVIYRIGVTGMGKVVLWIFNVHKNDFMAGVLK
jgi:hypothetical protein